jgi:hypothetical protein
MCSPQALLPVVLTGTPGFKLSGNYFYAGETLNGKPVYAKEDRHHWLFFSKTKKWHVGDLKEKETNSLICYAYSDVGVSHPTKTSMWFAYVESEFQAQKIPTNYMVSCPFH